MFRALGVSTTTVSKSLTNGIFRNRLGRERGPIPANEPLSTSCGTINRRFGSRLAADHCCYPLAYVHRGATLLKFNLGILEQCSLPGPLSTLVERLGTASK